MSELTMCNYCSLEWLKKRHAGNAVELKPENGGLRVWIGGKKYGAWMDAITDHCVC